MKRKTILVSASLLALGLTSITTGHAIAPILPVDPSLFTPLADVEPISSPQIIIDTFPFGTPRPVKPDISLAPVEPKTVIVAPSSNGFRLDPNVSWYGPGFYGKRTACGLAFTKAILGVAHKTLPCGTLVTFRFTARDDGTTRTVTVPVIDRGPYVAGRQWDLSGGLCVYLHHCFTGSIYYAVGSPKR